MTFTREELQAIYNILDQVTVQGLAQKTMVVQIMAKIVPALQVVPEDGKVKDRLETVTE